MNKFATMKRLILLSFCAITVAVRAADSRPNILLCIADDASWHHFGANGDEVCRTPNFDRLARKGVNFTCAFCSSPSCTPSRGALLTGQDFWRLEDGADLWSRWPNKFAVYPDLLAKAGYSVGLKGKGWGPGDFKFGGRGHNPAGPASTDFATFLKNVPPGKPFCFWFGSQDPHRPYERGAGVKSGQRIEEVKVPPFLPDTPAVRSDILDYYFEIERFHRDVGVLLLRREPVPGQLASQAAQPRNAQTKLKLREKLNRNFAGTKNLRVAARGAEFDRDYRISSGVRAKPVETTLPEPARL